MSNLNPTYVPTFRSWNYSNPNKDYYTEQLIGTVQAVQLVQATDFQTRQPKYWSDGNPRFNVRIALADPNGDLVTFTFQKAGKAAREGKKQSVHMDLWHLTGDKDLADLIGKTIVITTQAGSYGANNPRPFQVAFAPEGTGPFELKQPLPEEFKKDEIVFDRPQAGAPQINGQFYAVPTAQPMQMPQPQPQYQQPVQQPMYQQQPQPMQPAIPNGMDPAIAAQMQQMGATNLQPVAQPGSVYDNDIPF